jgi:hypothetical protein
MLTTYGIAGTAYMVELPRDGAFFSTVTTNFGSGGIFTAPSAGVMTFKPTVRFRMPPFKNAQSMFDSDGGVTGTHAPLNGRVRSYQLVISGATNSGNNGTFVTTGLVGDAVQYTNGSGVAANPDSAASWTIKHRDIHNVVMDGRLSTYLSRGYRINRRGGKMIVILPYGTSETVRLSVAEMLRIKKGAGIALTVERRVNP